MLRISAIKRVMRMREALDAFDARRQIPLSPILRTCPFCCAKPLRECTTMGGRKRKFHQQRRAPSWGRR